MLLKQENFFEKERNSPLFSRSGIKKDTDLVMLLPKFRHILRETRINRKKCIYTKGVTPNGGVQDSKSSESEITPTKDGSAVKGLEKTGTSSTRDSASTCDEKEVDPRDAGSKVEDLAEGLDKLKVREDSDASQTVPAKLTETPTSRDTALTPVLPDVPNISPEVRKEMHRIFRLDAERTFLDQAHRDIFYENLCYVFDKLGDYHQGEGFVIALMSIYMKSSEIVEVLDLLNTFILKGYFSAKPRSYVRDAKVLMKLLDHLNPKLHEKLDSLIVPEAFVSKWFIGLYIHVFDFETVADSIDYLIGHGQTFLFKLGLSFLMHFESELLGTNDVSYALQLLRLDDAVMPREDSERSKIYRDILSGSFKHDVDLVQLERYRLEVEAEMLSAEERRKKFEYEDDEDEIVFSDEE